MHHHNMCRSPFRRGMARRSHPRSSGGRAMQDALENIVRELENLRVLKEHELGVRLEEAPEGSGPYVPKVEK
jgi:hypothetical protein